MTSDTGPTVASHRISGHIGGRKQSGPYPHIDDLLQVTPEGNTSQPIGHLLGIAENGVKFAQFNAGVGKIDVALREYIKAYVVAVQIIPTHRDYTSLQTDRKNLGDRYSRLTKTLSEYTAAYENIKQTIKDDNARTGVQRATRTTSAPNGRPQTPKSQPSAPTVPASPSRQTASPGKMKPAVQPKPANLHGKAIKKPTTAGKGEDLAQRFANLRGPVQDPRIRTQPPPVPIPADKPAGPREMPKKPPISLEGVIPVLPKLPDAIYSPARGSISNEAAELPSSTPRGMYSRTNTSVYSAAKSPPTQDYFGSNGSTGPTSAPTPEKKRIPLPEGDIITVEELVKYQRIGSKDFRILVIDVRSRPEFEEGHILSSATICIEPDILQRDRIEAADVEDAMELGPPMEKWHFERRYEFNMIVFYDNDSEHLSSGSTNAPATLFRLLTDFDYPDGDPGSKHPKLLKGGLEAWQDAMGGSALQKSSKTAGHKRRQSHYDWLKVRSPSKPIQSIEEARRWEEKLTQLKSDETDDGSGDEFHPVRSLSDFMTRFPPVQESMTSPPALSPTTDNNLTGRFSPVPVRASPPQRSPQRAHFDPILPSEPTRPPPAVPRRSYTGLRTADDDHGTPTKLTKRLDAANRRRAVGLQNPGAWCYANSTLQALFSSGAFGEELMSGAWAQLYKAPMKSDENIVPPQLLTKILANLFHWMGNGKFPSMQAKTLMEYLRQKSSRNSQGKRVHESQILGTHRQQDAMEFFGYVFTELDDETNRFRDRPSEVPQPTPSKTKSLTDLAIQYWDLHSRVSDSIIDKYWRITEVVIVRCDHCGHVVTKYSNKDMQFLSLPQSSEPVMIEDLLQRDYSNEHLDDYTCDNCSSKGHCWKGTKLARLPDFLCVCFTRFEKNDESARFSKITTTVDFPIRELDLTPYTVQGQQAYSSLLTNGHAGTSAVTSPTSTIPTDDHHFNKPFRYEAYAVVQHGGELNSGHYVAAIRDEPHGPDGTSKWHVADDARISELAVGPSRSDKGSQFLHRQSQHWGGGMQAFMVFYQRKDAELV
ncbi:hypothetical protein N8I77_011580 [Diaporthe amygdali]|uniref:Uncharacterized protein n=1 Tax=Phomopsis amygdali TaxID=1214568 RepID=A0AAD9S8L3_PHOAM|nr:ubiquitin carboxyl-terminal hydrolase [Diaporthe amygdali]KAJ0108213.1 ubiquitin carboxyl-terminal hydrolase [Diaporthe amygdali]KAK2599858.1 hypothetical protein N8I77_011580 [Diaporthe amygdali]